MFKFIERIQYSLIYLLFKGKVFKTGKGYFYRANNTIGIPLVFVITINIKNFSGFRFSGNQTALLFLVVYILIFTGLECNVRRKKLYQHRGTFLNKGFYLKIFFGVMLFLLLATGLLWSFFRA